MRAGSVVYGAVSSSVIVERCVAVSRIGVEFLFPKVALCILD